MIFSNQQYFPNPIHFQAVLIFTPTRYNGKLMETTFNIKITKKKKIIIIIICCVLIVIIIFILLVVFIWKTLIVRRKQETSTEYDSEYDSESSLAIRYRNKARTLRAMGPILHQGQHVSFPDSIGSYEYSLC